MKNIKVKRVQADGFGWFEFDFLITDLKNNMVFWVNPGLNFAIYKNFSEFIENNYNLICDGNKIKELIINLANLEEIREFIILKDGIIHLHGRIVSTNLIIIDSEYCCNRLNVSIMIRRDYLPRFIEILSRFKCLPFHKEIHF